MSIHKINTKSVASLTFLCIFSFFITLGFIWGSLQPAEASFTGHPNIQTTGYSGPEFCGECHQDIFKAWETTRHALAFSTPIFQKDWTDLGLKTQCLSCHTTGFDQANGGYAHEGVTCEACHGPFQPNHPQEPMPIKPDADLCSKCHETTTAEWQASPHSKAGIQCQACHNPHSQKPKAETITGLCSNCHKEKGDSFTHGTHANSGLECSNCHMYKSPRMTDPIEGLVPTGHTFVVGSEACIGCHQDTVHTRDVILKLSGEVAKYSTVDINTLQQQVQQQEETIANLETRSTVRLYTGLAQGAIIGLLTGGVAAWIVSKGIRVIEENENDQEKG